jgi:hypothetical protein
MSEENGTIQPVDQRRLVRLLELHEDLGNLQPHLEFMDADGNWKFSGVINGTVSKHLLGRYRVILQNSQADRPNV